MAEKQAKSKSSVHPHKMYEKKGEALAKKNRSCPKCGPGYFMANHKDRVTCGRCHYTEFSKKEKK
jgi:small subunit ribosomal protein S27Ae